MQERGGEKPRYIIKTVAERNIPKFKVRGWEYRISILEMQEDLNYLEAVQVLHRTLDRKYHVQ